MEYWMNTITLKRDFPLTLTIGQAIELRNLGIIDVFEVATLFDQLKFIFTDRDLQARLIWELTDKARWTFESFRELLSEADQGELMGAVAAVIVDYFPPMKRPMIRAIFVSVNAAQDVAVRRMLDLLTQSEQSSENETTNGPGTESGIWPESLVSTRSHLPGENSTSWPLENSEQTGIAQARCSL